MQLCKNCYVPMIGATSFTKDKRDKFCRYPKYFGETNHVKLRDDGLTFGEVLHKEFKK